MKKLLEISSFYKCAAKITFILCMLPEIWSATDTIVWHFRPFFAILTPKIKIWKKCKKKTQRYYLFTHVYYKWRSCDVWFLRYGAQQTEFFSHFGPLFTLLKKLEKKKKKMLGDIIIITQVCHKWHTHDVWFLRYEAWHNFFSVWAIFCPLTTLTIEGPKFLKKWKPLKISSFSTCSKNYDQMM